MVYRSLTSCFNAFTNLFSQIGLSPGLFLVGSSTKSKLDTKYDFKETTISVFSLNIFQDLTTFYRQLITFLTFLSLKFMNSFSCFLHSCKIMKSSTFTESFLALFPACKCVNDTNILLTLCTSYFLKETVTLSSYRIFIVRRMLCNYPSLMKMFLLIFGMSSNDVAISAEPLSLYLNKMSKNLSSSSLVPSVVDS